MKYRIIEDCRNEFPVRSICAALDVSPSGYYAWKSRSPSPRAEENRRLLDDIRRLHERHRHRYGVPRMLVELRKEGWTVSRGRVSRLMRRHGIRACRQLSQMTEAAR